MRWYALGVFLPLMRNHSEMGTRLQEVYRFTDIEGFKNIIGLRYRLLPYIYSEYMKAVLRDDLMFRPLAFDHPDDARCKTIEDQLYLGDELMIAPVYEQNAKGRYVYLPERRLSFPTSSSSSERDMRSRSLRADSAWTRWILTS